MTHKVTSLPTASAQLPGGQMSAPAGAFYTDTAPAASAGVAYPPSPLARLIRRGLVLAFVALLTIGVAQTATKAIEKVAYQNLMQAKGW